MKIFTWAIMSCYMVLFTLLGIGLVVFALHWIPIDGALYWFQMAYLDQNIRIACGATGGGLILLNWIIMEMTWSKMKRQKTIAFDNPDGQVTIALQAIEDLIRRATREIPEVKEIRSHVVARKGKIMVSARATLWSEARIPEVTEKVQALIRSRIQEMLSGIEDPVSIKMHVSKIAHRDERRKPPALPPPVEGEQVITPFRGF